MRDKIRLENKQTELPRGDQGAVRPLREKRKHTYSQRSNQLESGGRTRAKGTPNLPLKAEHTVFVGLGDAIGAALRGERD